MERVQTDARPNRNTAGSQNESSHTHSHTHTHTHTLTPTHTHTHTHTHSRKQNSDPRNNIISPINTIQPAKCTTLIAINQRDLHVPHAIHIPRMHIADGTFPSAAPESYSCNTAYVRARAKYVLRTIINNASQLIPIRFPEMNSKLMRIRPSG